MKKIIIGLIFLFLCSTVVFADNIKDSETYYNQGNAKTNLKEAIKDFNKAIELNPKFAEAYLTRGMTKARLQDYTGAIKDYNKALELNPKCAKAYYNRGLLSRGH